MTTIRGTVMDSRISDNPEPTLFLACSALRRAPRCSTGNFMTTKLQWFPTSLMREDTVSWEITGEVVSPGMSASAIRSAGTLRSDI
jgi:hypothetical protein